jgi:hypothetical protein
MKMADLYAFRLGYRIPDAIKDWYYVLVHIKKLCAEEYRN